MYGKIVESGDLAGRLERLRGKGCGPVVFTNGCFDIVHAGHVRYLAKAKALGELLVVGLNSDVSVRSIKGPKRPIVCQEDRAEILSALQAVDFVTFFDEDTPLRLIELLKPDILVKGKDYEGKTVVGREVVEASGGKVLLLDFEQGRATSNVIRTILERYGRWDGSSS